MSQQKTLAEIIRGNNNLRFNINGEDCKYTEFITIDGKDVVGFHLGCEDIVYIYGSDTGVAVNNKYREFVGWHNINSPDFTFNVVLELWTLVS